MASIWSCASLSFCCPKAVYQIPTHEDTTDTVPLALQRVFYNLQTSDQPVGEAPCAFFAGCAANINVVTGTTELTKSFGWKGFDSFLQHDVQEFNRVLQDKLEEKMKVCACAYLRDADLADTSICAQGTTVDGEVKRLFAGTTKMFVKCINIEFESARSELFYGQRRRFGRAFWPADTNRVMQTSN